MTSTCQVPLITHFLGSYVRITGMRHEPWACKAAKLLIQRIPDQLPEIDNRLFSIRRACDVSMPVLFCRDLEVELLVLRANPAGLRKRVAALGWSIEDDVVGYGHSATAPAPLLHRPAAALPATRRLWRCSPCPTRQRASSFSEASARSRSLSDQYASTGISIVRVGGLGFARMDSTRLRIGAA